MRASRRLLLWATLLAMGMNCYGQEARGSIAGRVTDPQAASIIGVAIVLTHNETNVTSRSVSNQDGYFEVNLLQPGMYSVAAEAAGFKKLTRRGVELSTGGRIELELRLELGQVSETVDVTESAPLLDTVTATSGRIISRRQILDLPFPDMNPFLMSYFAPGMVYTGVLQDTKPWDNAAISRFNTMGGVGQNQFTVDGASVNGTDRRVGFAPPSDAVEEFRVEVSSFDATVAQATGATINVTTRAGTNTFHGAVFDQHYQRRWNATPHFDRLAWEDAVRRGLRNPNEPKQGAGRLNDTGFAVGGPVLIPKLYSGRDKFFFFFNYTGIWLRNASSNTLTVPKTNWRQGDFSDLLGVDPGLYTIYDPRSARLQNGRVVRTPFPENRGIPILNPLYKFVQPIYPLPNNLGANVTADGLNNYTSLAGASTGETYWALLNRIDYNISERHRVFGRWFWNDRHTVGSDWSQETLPGVNRNSGVRIDKGVGVDYIWVPGPSVTVNLGVNYNRFGQGTQGYGQTEYKPSDIGFPGYLDVRAGNRTQMPRIDFTGINDLSSTWPVVGDIGSTGEVKLAMTWVKNSHSLKWGWNERRYTYSLRNFGYTSGQFVFDNTYVRAQDNTNTAAQHGLEWAAFMMGVPSAIRIDTNDSAVFTTPYRAFYFQDDFRISRKLRMSLALRYEHEGGIRERFHRGVAGGFLHDAKLPITDLAQAAYAANPLAELPASQFRVLGGTTYLGKPYETYSNGTHRLMPRFSVVYQVNPNTVLRMGYGQFYDTFNNNNFRPSQDGFSQQTSTILTNDVGLSFCCGLGPIANLSASNTPLHDPFPVRADGTRFDEPYGSARGLMSFAGRGATILPRDFAPAFQQRWRISLQREILRDVALDISYNGAYARIPVDQRVDYLPGQYWAYGNMRNQAVEDDMNRNVTNPFYLQNFASLQSTDPILYTYMSRTAFFASSTVRKNSLLRQFPQMNGLAGLRPGQNFSDARGVNRYHDIQLQIEKRFSRGLMTSFMYTRSWGVTSDYYHNEFDGAPTWRTNNGTRPHRATWMAIYELPFGAGKPLAHDGLARHFFGNWQLGGVYQFQSGPATSWGNVFYYGDLGSIGEVLNHEQVNAQDIHQWFDTSVNYKGSGAIPAGFKGFEGRASNQPGAFHARVFPTVLDTLRGADIRRWDARVQRSFTLHERLRAKFFVDLINVTNHTIFEPPNTNPTNANFGRVTTVNGRPRLYQFTLRFEF